MQSTQRFEYCNECERFVDNFAHHECSNCIGWVREEEISSEYECEVCGKWGEPFSEICLYNRRVCRECLLSMEVGRCDGSMGGFRTFCSVCLIEKGIIDCYEEPLPSRCDGCHIGIEFYSWEINIHSDGKFYCRLCAYSLEETHRFDQSLLHFPHFSMCQKHKKIVSCGKGYTLNPKYNEVSHENKKITTKIPAVKKRNDALKFILGWQREDNYEEPGYYETFMDSPKYLKKILKRR